LKFSIDTMGIQEDTLAVHNALRAAHGAPPLEWSDECAEWAQKQADAMAEKGSLFHGNQGPDDSHGQNCAMASPEIDATAAIKMWYNEVNDPGYNFDSPGFTGGTGHFTQVVWKESTKVGLAVNGNYVAANYLPAGNMNMPGEFEKNVLKSASTDFDKIQAGEVKPLAAEDPAAASAEEPAAEEPAAEEKQAAASSGWSLFSCCAGSSVGKDEDIVDKIDTTAAES
jgi:hypothetical protein